MASSPSSLTQRTTLNLNHLKSKFVGSRMSISTGVLLVPRCRPQLHAPPSHHHPAVSRSRSPSWACYSTGTASARPITTRLPQGTWDTHMHVLDPVNFRLSPTAVYTPNPHTLASSASFYDNLGIRNLVFVQPSIYGTDNSCLLAALSAIGPTHGRAVVDLDPQNMSRSTLQDWHGLGVRGVRINLKSGGAKSLPDTFADDVKRVADLIRPMGNWGIHFHVTMDMIGGLRRVIEEQGGDGDGDGLGVKICVDHFGSPPSLPPSGSSSSSSAFDPYGLSGFEDLVSLLLMESGRLGGKKVFVKLSAPYRFSSDGSLKNIEVLAKVLLEKAPDHCVFATDWPHTRYEGVDVTPFVEGLLNWTEEVGGKTLVEKVFRDNAIELLDG